MDKASKLLLPIRYDFVQVVGSLIQKLCKIFPTCYTYKGMLKPTTLNFRFISNLHHLSDTTCLTDTNENGLSIASLLFSFSKLLKPVNYFPSFLHKLRAYDKWLNKIYIECYLFLLFKCEETSIASIYEELTLSKKLMFLFMYCQLIWVSLRNVTFSSLQFANLWCMLFEKQTELHFIFAIWIQSHLEVLIKIKLEWTSDV